MFFKEVQGMDKPWHPALIQERILLSSAMSVDPFPQASSLPEAPHPANSDIFCRSVSERAMLWTRAWLSGARGVTTWL